MVKKLIKRYYEYKHRAGHGFIASTSLLPFEAIRHLYIKSRFKEGHVITGYHLYDKPLLATYSRSGTNWVRYIIEYISGQPTPAKPKLHSHGYYAIDRAHRAFPIMHKYKKVILVIRNYRECLLRHQSKLWQRTLNVPRFLNDTSVEQPPNWYIKNIESFHRFKKQKLLLYYEDLITNPEKETVKLAEFLELDPRKTESFIEHIDERYQESIHTYISENRKSYSARKKDLTYHTKEKLSESQIKEFDLFYEQRYPNLFDKYLRRYKV